MNIICYRYRMEIQKTLKSHDIELSVMHLKNLVDESERDQKQAYNYIKQFFFRYGTEVFTMIV